MSFWRKLCKILITEQQNKFEDKTNTEISKCVSLKSSSIQKSSAKDIINEEKKFDPTETNGRHPVARNVSVSRSGRYRQKVRRRSALFDIPEDFQRKNIHSKCQSIETRISDLNSTNNQINSNQTSIDESAQVCQN